jgi:hypothetical protein
MHANHRDLAAGAVFILIGACFGLNAWFTLRIGEAQAMGPGYFPVTLGAVLVALGVAIGLNAVGKGAEPFGHVSWRGVVLVAVSIFLFAMTVRGLGFGPALFVSTLLAALASGRLSLAGSALLAICMSVFSAGVFIYALRLPYPVIGRWLGG